MPSKLFSTTGLAAGLLFGLTHVSHVVAQDNFTLYAYGNNVSGSPIFYANSLAYVGYIAPPELNATNVTFTLNGTSLHTKRNTTAGGSAPITGDPRLFIDTSTGATNQVGYTTSSISNTTATTTNFRFFGNVLYWVTSTNELVAKFWVTATDTDGVHSLVWNEPDDVLADSVPVTLRSTPPAPAPPAAVSK